MATKAQRNKGGRPRGRANQKKIVKPSSTPEQEAVYRDTAARLLIDSRVDSSVASEHWISTVVDCDRHLDDLRRRMQDGSITSDERKSVSALMTRRDLAMVRLGLDAHKRKVTRL